MGSYVWSIDDAGSGGGEMVESLNRSCEFFESRGVRATWFVVPKSKEEPMTGDWKEALLKSRDGGHDLQLHGLTHADCYEFGPPAWPATSISPSYSSDFESRRDELMSRYTVEKLRGRIEEGIEIFERELGIHPTVFRAPCGAISKPMFEALKQVGISYHTCYYISASGYEHLPHRSGVIRQDWKGDVPNRPFRWYSGIIEAPILNEYTWRGAWQREEEFIALAKNDIDRAVQESPLVVFLMHTHGIADNYDYAFRVIDAVMEHLDGKSGWKCSTLGKLAESGELAQGATVEGPDIL